MLLPVDVHMAKDSIRNSRWRSFLTMLGVIVGVASVVTIVSIGQGVKQQVESQIGNLGSGLITVRPGKVVEKDASGRISDINLFQAFASGGATLNDNDFQTIRSVDNAKSVAPLNTVSGVASINGQDCSSCFVYGTTQDFPAIYNQKILYGGFFTDTGKNRTEAVVGTRVAQELFKQNAPIGRSFSLDGQTFIVSGVFDEFAANPLSPTTDYNRAIFIPYDTALKINDNQAQIVQILVRPERPEQANQLTATIHNALRSAHNGQVDFTILSQEDNLTIANRVVDLLTALISAIAAISLLVGGVGIMNIMLVSVSERTHEIGIRKAVGATNTQILRQFLIEAAFISLLGGLIGIIIALVANYFIRLFTFITPAIDVSIMGIAILVAVAVGIFFGVAPAVKAARKDPIEALRQAT